MFDHASAAVEGALAAGATYADARVEDLTEDDDRHGPTLRLGVSMTMARTSATC